MRFRELLAVELAGEAAAAPSTSSPDDDVVGLPLLLLFESGLSTCWKVVGVKLVVNVNE